MRNVVLKGVNYLHVPSHTWGLKIYGTIELQWKCHTGLDGQYKYQKTARMREENEIQQHLSAGAAGSAPIQCHSDNNYNRTFSCTSLLKRARIKNFTTALWQQLYTEQFVELGSYS